jgi:hypothetical protein
MEQQSKKTLYGAVVHTDERAYAFETLHRAVGEVLGVEFKQNYIDKVSMEIADNLIEKKRKSQNRYFSRLKRSIPEGTQLVELYNDGEMFWFIDGSYYPADFNKGKHPDFF